MYSGRHGTVRRPVELAQGADILVHMCHYVSGTEYNQAMSWGTAGHRHAAEHAQRADVGTLVLTHMTRQVDADGVRERVVKEIGEIYGGRAVVGEDLKTIGTVAPEIGNPL